MIYDLTRTQIEQLHALITTHPGKRDVQISYGTSTGIGTNVYATLQDDAGQVGQTIDITDYENW